MHNICTYIYYAFMEVLNVQGLLANSSTAFNLCMALCISTCPGQLVLPINTLCLADYYLFVYLCLIFECFPWLTSRLMMC